MEPVDQVIVIGVTTNNMKIIMINWRDLAIARKHCPFNSFLRRS